MKSKPNGMAEAVKDYVRHPWVWPGGYPRFALLDDGECLCHRCAKSEFATVLRSTIQQERDGWCVVAIDINWEDVDMYCAHCNERMESAYGEERYETH